MASLLNISLLTFFAMSFLLFSSKIFPPTENSLSTETEVTFCNLSKLRYGLNGINTVQLWSYRSYSRSDCTSMKHSKTRLQSCHSNLITTQLNAFSLNADVVLGVVWAPGAVYHIFTRLKSTLKYFQQSLLSEVFVVQIKEKDTPCP